MRFQNPTVLGILKLNRQTRSFNKKENIENIKAQKVINDLEFNRNEIRNSIVLNNEIFIKK